MWHVNETETKKTKKQKTKILKIFLKKRNPDPEAASWRIRHTPMPDARVRVRVYELNQKPKSMLMAVGFSYFPFKN
jgi:hypothetical protein